MVTGWFVTTFEGYTCARITFDGNGPAELADTAVTLFAERARAMVAADPSLLSLRTGQGDY